jgi:uncharacterized repeat protein (TIGR03803 family)
MRSHCADFASRVRRLTSTAGVVLTIVLVTASLARGQLGTYRDLYNFNGNGGDQNPFAGVTRDSAGNLYGTTSGIGIGDGCCGTVFKLSLSDGKWIETVLYRFTGGADGATPLGSLVFDSGGNLYGTTFIGGSGGQGTVFKVNPSGKETVLHSFTLNGIPDGTNPYAGLLLVDGYLYGTTSGRGEGGYGTVFKVATDGTGFSVLYSFCNCQVPGGMDGALSQAVLVRDSAGNLYGTTSLGGDAGYGTVFKLDPSGNETILHSFLGTGGDGAQPTAGLVLDGGGNLYGTTTVGGNQECGGNPPPGGCGTVFKLTSSGEETVLHIFTRHYGRSWYGLTRDERSGVLYGSTDFTVFKLDSVTGKLEVVHRFTNAEGGPSGVVNDAAGDLYGTTEFGGGFFGDGTVFEIIACPNGCAAASN